MKTDMLDDIENMKKINLILWNMFEYIVMFFIY